jgi:hypothetical protein
VAGVGDIQAVGCMINEGINIFYIICKVEDKPLDCQVISLGAMIFIAAKKFIMKIASVIFKYLNYFA